MPRKSLREAKHRKVKDTVGTEDPLFWAWFAGFWEGEGSAVLGQARGSGLHPVRISVCQKNKIPLDVIRERTGLGELLYRPPQENTVVKSSGVWNWAVWNRRGVIMVGRRLLPYLTYRGEMLARVVEQAERDEANTPCKVWTISQIATLKELYPDGTHAEIEAATGHTWQGVAAKAYLMRYRRNPSLYSLKPREDNVNAPAVCETIGRVKRVGLVERDRDGLRASPLLFPEGATA